MIYKLVYLASLLGVSGYALWRGGRPERFVAIIMLLGSFLSIPAAHMVATIWQSPEFGILAVDLVVLALLIFLLLLSDRFWPIWITAIQFVSVAIHFAVMVELTIVPRAYAMAQGFWAYPMLIVLMIGTLSHRRLIIRRAGTAI
jgi:hypothetical protein